MKKVSNSRRIDSNQTTLHHNLQKIVEKHQATHFAKPIADHTLRAFEAVNTRIHHNATLPLIMDSGCGTAMSTRLLAQQYPQAWVIGIDRSIKRLSKQYHATATAWADLPDNALLIQADLIDFWRLAVQAGWQLERHFLLYPNPYPKSVHLKRRFHAHPVFGDLLTLGGTIELRTNWDIYAQEFCFSARLMNKQCQGVECIRSSNPLTLFEKKYQESGQMLYRTLIR